VELQGNTGEELRGTEVGQAQPRQPIHKRWCGKTGVLVSGLTALAPSLAWSAPRGGGWRGVAWHAPELWSIRHLRSHEPLIAQQPLTPTPRSLLPRGNIQRTRGCMRNHHLSELSIVKEGGKDAAMRIEQPAAAGPWPS
jgi:hypothetical protein